MDVEVKSEWSLAGLKAADEPLYHIFLNPKLTELPDACCALVVVVPSPMIEVVDLVVLRVSDPIAGDI